LLQVLHDKPVESDLGRFARDKRPEDTRLSPAQLGLISVHFILDWATNAT
jgi:hypothetical protein